MIKTLITKISNIFSKNENIKIDISLLYDENNSSIYAVPMTENLYIYAENKVYPVSIETYNRLFDENKNPKLITIQQVTYCHEDLIPQRQFASSDIKLINAFLLAKQNPINAENNINYFNDMFRTDMLYNTWKILIDNSINLDKIFIRKFYENNILDSSSRINKFYGGKESYNGFNLNNNIDLKFIGNKSFELKESRINKAEFFKIVNESKFGVIVHIDYNSNLVSDEDDYINICYFNLDDLDIIIEEKEAAKLPPDILYNLHLNNIKQTEENTI